MSAGAVGFDGDVQLLDLLAGKHGAANSQFKRHIESVADLKRQIQQNGTAAIYGIHFDIASAKLRPDSLLSLNQIMTRDEQLGIAVDDRGAHLQSRRRGLQPEAVARARAFGHDVLTQHGVAGDVLTAKGYGLTRPVADNATDSGRALNRRVEVSLVKHEKKTAP